ncbi:hypothetical protein EGJ48_14920 [Pantoea dispersa]|nr:hypothetical protein EGJ48_14920 [Pantoea dispersa]
MALEKIKIIWISLATLSDDNACSGTEGNSFLRKYAICRQQQNILLYIAEAALKELCHPGPR